MYTTGQLAKEATKRGRRISRQAVTVKCQAGEIEAKLMSGVMYLIEDNEAERWLRKWLRKP